MPTTERGHAGWGGGGGGGGGVFPPQVPNGDPAARAQGGEVEAASARPRARAADGHSRRGGVINAATCGTFPATAASGARTQQGDRKLRGAGA